MREGPHESLGISAVKRVTQEARAKGGNEYQALALTWRRLACWARHVALLGSARGGARCCGKKGGATAPAHQLVRRAARAASQPMRPAWHLAAKAAKIPPRTRQCPMKSEGVIKTERPAVLLKSSWIDFPPFASPCKYAAQKPDRIPYTHELSPFSSSCAVPRILSLTVLGSPLPQRCAGKLSLALALLLQAVIQLWAFF